MCFQQHVLFIGFVSILMGGKGEGVRPTALDFLPTPGADQMELSKAYVFEPIINIINIVNFTPFDKFLCANLILFFFSLSLVRFHCFGCWEIIFMAPLINGKLSAALIIVLFFSFFCIFRNVHPEGKFTLG